MKNMILLLINPVLKYSHMVTKMRLIVGAIIITLIASLCACDQSSNNSEEKTTATTLKVSHRCASPKNMKCHKQLWGRLRDNFDIGHKQKHAIREQRVQKYVKQFAKAKTSIHRISTDAKPYMYYIIEQLEKRNMPGELALLPMIESNFKPHATSHCGAAGIWQFMPGTGRMFGLKQGGGYDGRRDIKASTDAALDYLQSLHKEFGNNWMLALAAYNAGPGTVRKAIKRNQRAGKSTNFFDLSLPQQTKDYVPKFLALAEVIKNPGKHSVSLPEIENKPYFTPVEIKGKAMNFNQAAKLADVEVSELKRLNPGFRQTTISHPKKGEAPQILVPVEKATKFEYNVKKNQ